MNNKTDYQIGLTFFKAFSLFIVSIVSFIVVIVLACCDGSSGWAFVFTCTLLISFVFSVYNFFKGLILAIKTTK